MSHSYLIISLVATTAALGAVFFLVRARWVLMTAGILAAPAGLADALFVPEYWSPVHIVSKNFSIEGVLFSFGNGVLVAAVATVWALDSHLHRTRNIFDLFFRLTALMLIGFLVFLVFWQHGFGNLMIMHAAFAGFAAMFLTLALTGWLSGRVMLIGGLGFLLIYLAQTVLWVWLDPSATKYWSADTYLITLPFRPYLPLEEFIWSFLYGALWAAMLQYGFRIPLKPPRRSDGVVC